MSNLRAPRIPGGSVGQQVSLGGEEAPDGKPAGGIIIVPDSRLSGAEQLRHMVATLDTGAPSGAADIYNDATGVKAFTVTVDPDTTLAAASSIVVAYGTTAGDTGVEANAIACSLEQGGTRTGNAYTSVVVLNANNPSQTVIWDYTNTIKRIVAVTSDTTTDNSVTLVTVG